jgi:cyclophilin family peptidyl-prolyl cis-trans isomerase
MKSYCCNVLFCTVVSFVVVTSSTTGTTTSVPSFIVVEPSQSTTSRISAYEQIGYEEDDENDDEHNNDNNNNNNIIINNNGKNSRVSNTRIIPYNKKLCQARPHTIIPNSDHPPLRAPDQFLVKFPTTTAAAAATAAGGEIKRMTSVTDEDDFLSSGEQDPSSSSSSSSIVMEVHRSWAPIGVDRLWGLLNDHCYDCAAFFRVVPHFVVQFGIASTPTESQKWENNPIDDDPVIHRSNVYSYVSYASAGPNTRTTPLFINTGNNSHLDTMGFAPFGKIISGIDDKSNTKQY